MQLVHTATGQRYAVVERDEAAGTVTLRRVGDAGKPPPFVEPWDEARFAGLGYQLVDDSTQPSA